MHFEVEQDGRGGFEDLGAAGFEDAPRRVSTADGIGVVETVDFNRLGHRALDGWHGRGRPCPQWEMMFDE